MAKTKDVNIHIQTPGADKARRDLDAVSDSTKRVGDDVAKAGDKTKTAASSFAAMATKFLSITAAIAALKKGLDMYIERLQIAHQLQKDFASSAASMASVGQALELQTGTVGQSMAWTQRALAVQKAGGLGDINTAKDLMVSADIAFGTQGGIKNRQVMDLLKEISPFVGSAQLSSEEAAKLFEFATTAGVAPTKQAHQDYFAKLKAGFTSSKATSFGSFMQYLQQGGTAYIGQGGSLEEAISLFSSARSVSPNEAQAATLMQNLSLVATGAKERPRRAMEQSLGVNWSTLSADQRKDAVIKFIGSLPASQREQFLSEAGVEGVMAAQLSKLVTPDALQTAHSTRAAVTGASAFEIERSNAAYMRSMLGRENVRSAESSRIDLSEGGKYYSWQRRLKDAQKQYQALAAEGKDSPFISSTFEPILIALEQLESDYDKQIELSSGRERDELISAKKALRTQQRILRYTPNIHGQQYSFLKTGQAYSDTLDAVERANRTVINNHYDHSTNYYPRTGPDASGPRYTQD